MIFITIIFYPQATTSHDTIFIIHHLNHFYPIISQNQITMFVTIILIIFIIMSCLT